MNDEQKVKICIMKIFLLVIIILTLGCKTEKDMIMKNSSSNCPEGGTCQSEFFENTIFKIQADEYGATYIKEMGSNQSSVRYSFLRDEMNNIADSYYKEELHILIPNENGTYEYNQENIKDLSFGRLCNCRGTTGYYPVEKANIKLNRNDEQIAITGTFSLSEVPHILKSINTTIKL